MKRAFTLVEIMVVVAILGVLVGITVPAFKAFLDKAPLERAISDIEGMCRLARSEAIMKERPMDVILNDSGNTATLSTAARVVNEQDEVTGEFIRNTKEAETLDSVELEAELEIIDPVPLLAGDDVRIRFYPNGTAETLELIVSEGGEGYRLILDPVTGQTAVNNLDDE